ncbi:protein-disulfide reductase DsbD N-terminal domain-containing protein, partial [Stenotrophomonas maltophilia]|uniref:protein-disulfide reductase DsbD N-terminal domain-containing protein n=1 Tax=Stenotrophomonas maltophilia TaxID=40324 RepID=UPI000519C2D0
AFGFDAIASDGNPLLLRFSPAPGYYLYRDRTSLKLEGSAGVLADKPRWPAAQSHRDEHFGDVSVYFNQVEVPLPLRRSVADAVDSTLVVTFQGCQTDG